MALAFLNVFSTFLCKNNTMVDVHLARTADDESSSLCEFAGRSHQLEPREIPTVLVSLVAG